MRRLQVPRLVLEAFVGPCPAGWVARRAQGADPNSCAAADLRWGPPGGTGGACAGHRNHNARLTDAEVRAIRRRRAAGERLTHLAQAFGVRAVGVHNICARKSWKHLA